MSAVHDRIGQCTLQELWTKLEVKPEIVSLNVEYFHRNFVNGWRKWIVNVKHDYRMEKSMYPWQEITSHV